METDIPTLFYCSGFPKEKKEGGKVGKIRMPMKSHHPTGQSISTYTAASSRMGLNMRTSSLCS